MKKADKQAAILDAEERAANWLARGNELAEKGKRKAAERCYENAEGWLMRANRLRKW